MNQSRPQNTVPGTSIHDGGQVFTGTWVPTTYPDVSQFVKDMRTKLSSAVDSSQKLPRGDVNYLVCSTYPEFKQRVKLGSAQVVSMMKDLSAYWGVPQATHRQFDNPQNKARVVQGVHDTTKQLKERMDLMLDEVARLKDEQEGSSRRKTPGNTPVALQGFPQDVRKPGRTLAIPRPQVSYGWLIDNSFGRFVPKITSKPNALRSLDRSMEVLDEQEPTPHPYQFELDIFEPGAEFLACVVPRHAMQLEETPFEYIDTIERFRTAVQEMSAVSELAVDLEHHSYRTYLGITCLLQISSRLKDYVIDTIRLRDAIHELNPVFTNPQILKVFHGGNMDIQWLQRDFGIYVVNMFDTGQAARALLLPKFSLAYLFQHYLGRTIDKKHQLSDWRIRPLPEDMLLYARMDTHELLFLADCVRNDLLRKDPSLQLINEVYAQSKILCLQRYEKPTMDSQEFAQTMWRFAKTFSEQQKYALKRLLEWRDETARDLDESTGFILPAKICVDLAETLPRTADDLVKAIEFMPVVLKQKVHQVLQLLKEARAFTGIIPVPVVNLEHHRDEADSVMQRQLRQPLTANDFVAKYLGTVPSNRYPLDLLFDAAVVPDRTEGEGVQQMSKIWAQFVTTRDAEAEEKAKFIPVPAPVKPLVVASVPKELPLAPVENWKASNKFLSTGNLPVNSVFTGKNYAAAVKTTPTKKVPDLDEVTPTHQNIQSETSSADDQAKRPVFDYQTADYSRFNTSGSGNSSTQKRQVGRNRDVKDPNKSFNKQRNMSNTHSSKTFVNSKFRKPE